MIKVSRQWGIDVSKETVKRIIKKMNMLWKRLEKGMSIIPNSWQVELNKLQLLELK